MKRHAVEVLSLGGGIAFLVFGLAYLVGSAIGTPPNGLIALPLLFVALGAAAVTTLIVSQRRSNNGTLTDHSA